MTEPTVLTVAGVRVAFGEAEVLRGLDLTVRRGEVVAIVGPSGSGKSTLLRTVNYLTPFGAGEVRVAGCVLTPGMSERRHGERLRVVRRRAGMVFQSFHLFAHLDALGNVEAGPRHVLGLPWAAARARATGLLHRVGLGHRAAARPHELSGGEQQRVAIARALAMEPDLLLLDEPTSALDPRLAGEVLAVVADLAVEGQTMLVVTHEMAFARRVAHRVLVLVDGQFVEEGPPSQVFERPKHAATRLLLGIG
jgi:polar amino acid transport system ATP-binding protein